MSPDLLLIVLLGGCAGGGLLLGVSALVPADEGPGTGAGSALTTTLRRYGRRVPFALLGGLVVLVLTRWPVLAVAMALLVFVGPTLIGGLAAERRAIARLEGLATWTESLRDTIAGAVGLEQAIPATAYAASPSIMPQLVALSDRLRVRTPLPLALQRFADDIDDSSADLIISALLLNSRLRGPGLRDVLSALAESAREELEMRRRVSASRASTRRSVQIVVGVSVLFILGLAVFNRDYVEPYGSPVGQLVLLVVLALFGVGFWWMRRLSVFEIPERFLLRSAGGGS